MKNRKIYKSLAIPGGFEEFGFYDEAYDEKLLNLIRDFNKQRKITTSVCVGALPLGKSGVLMGSEATTYHLKEAHSQKQLAEYGVYVMNERIVVDSDLTDATR